MSKKNVLFIIIIGILTFAITIGTISTLIQPKDKIDKSTKIEPEENSNTISIPEDTTKTVDLSSAKTEDGEPFKQEDYVDKNLIITFTNSACPHCSDQALEYQKLQDELDFKLFYIPTKETAKATSNSLNAIGIDNYNILIDKDNVLFNSLGVKLVPTSLIKKKGEESFTVVVGLLRKEIKGDSKKLLKDYIE